MSAAEGAPRAETLEWHRARPTQPQGLPCPPTSPGRTAKGRRGLAKAAMVGEGRQGSAPGATYVRGHRSSCFRATSPPAGTRSTPSILPAPGTGRPRSRPRGELGGCARPLPPAEGPRKALPLRNGDSRMAHSCPEPSAVTASHGSPCRGSSPSFAT